MALAGESQVAGGRIDNRLGHVENALHLRELSDKGVGFDQNGCLFVVHALGNKFQCGAAVLGAFRLHEDARLDVFLDARDRAVGAQDDKAGEFNILRWRGLVGIAGIPDADFHPLTLAPDFNDEGGLFEPCLAAAHDKAHILGEFRFQAAGTGKDDAWTLL